MNAPTLAQLQWWQESGIVVYIEWMGGEGLEEHLAHHCKIFGIIQAGPLRIKRDHEDCISVLLGLDSEYAGPFLPILTRIEPAGPCVEDDWDTLS